MPNAGHLRSPWAMAIGQQRTSDLPSGPGARADIAALPLETSERCPLLTIPGLVRIFDRLNRLDVLNKLG